MTKKAKLPKFTVQVKVVLIADVDVTGDGEQYTLEDAIAFGKTWKLRDVVKLDPAATECDSSTKVVGAWSQESWSIG